jgi:hypothetical protein
MTLLFKRLVYPSARIALGLPPKAFGIGMEKLAPDRQRKGKENESRWHPCELPDL